MVHLGADNLEIATVFAARLRLRQANLSNLGVSIGGPRDMRGFRLGRQSKKDRPGNDACVVTGHMGELQPACDIANGIDPPVRGGPQPVVDRDPAPLIGNIRLFKGQLFDIHLASHRHQEV